MSGFYIFNENFTEEELAAMEPRIKAAMEGWRVEGISTLDGPYSIPGSWSAEIYPYKYFVIVKEPDDPLPDPFYNEIMCYLSCGWKGTDDEAIIVLTLLGDAVLDTTKPVSAEIYKFGSNDMKVFRKGKLITNFKEKYCLFFKRDINKVIVEL